MAISQCAGLQLPSLSSWPQAQAGGPVPLNEDSARHWWRPRKELKQGRKAGAVQVPRWQWQSPGEGRRGSCRRCRSRDSPQTSQLRPNSADLYQPLMVESSSPADDGSPRKALRVVPEAAVLGASLLLLLVPAAWADGGGGTDTGWAAAVGEALYALGQNANALVQGQIQGGLTLTSGAVILGAGLVTSLSPCTLSVLPLTIGYIGGYDQGRSRAALVRDAAAFSLGLATTLAALGTGASLAGKAYGQVGAGLPIAASLTAMLMGLNLLEVLPLRFPSFLGNVDARELAAGLPSSVQAYLAGLVFALAASPCSTPVLATLLSYVATTQDPVVGSALLFTYTLGYVAPLLAAASFTGALKQLLELRKFSAWINPASGCLLLSGGLYTFLLRVVPAQ